MGKYILRRFLTMVVTVWVIITMTFILMHAIPGSPFDSERTTNEAVTRNLMAHYHLDQPKYLQYVTYLQSLIQLDLGPSISHSETVNEIIERAFPVSSYLGTVSLGFAVVSGIVLGVLAALRHNGIIDYVAMIISVIGISIPNFILATMLIQFVAVEWGLLPPATWGTWKHVVLPALALSTGPLAIIARLTRSNMLDVLTQDYIHTAKAKGLSPATIVIKHALRNALMPVVTVLGTLLAGILTGTFVIEKIFAIPGMGKYFVNGINNRDYPVIMGTTVFYSVILVFMMFLVDMAYGLLDPRIKLHKKEE